MTFDTIARVRRLSLLPLICLLVGCTSPLFVLGEEDDDFNNEIIGGEPAEVGEFPGFARGGGCGSTLIYEDVLLTAAHCDGPFGKNWRARRAQVAIGGIRAFDDGEIIDVDSRYPHPYYNSVTNDNDIMLVKLSSPSSAPPTVWNDNGSFPDDGDDATVIGYGETFNGSGQSPVLNKVVTPVVSSEECSIDWLINPSTMICAGGVVGENSCRGDSGGPLYVHGVQVGIVSYGPFECANDQPAVYTRVSFFREWIDNGICAISSNPPINCGRLRRSYCPCYEYEYLCRILNRCVFRYWA